MGFPFTMNGEFIIEFITNYYNNSVCGNFTNKIIHKIDCDEYLYSDTDTCCNNYITQYLNSNNTVDKCYNNSNLYYKYECRYIRNPDWYLGIMSFLLLICMCVCCLVIKCKKDEREEARERLISHS